MWIFLQGSRNAFVLECGVCVGVKRSTGGVRAADWACCVIKAGRAQQVKGAAAWGVITQEPCYVWDIGSPPTCVVISVSGLCSQWSLAW